MTTAIGHAYTIVWQRLAKALRPGASEDTLRDAVRDIHPLLDAIARLDNALVNSNALNSYLLTRLIDVGAEAALLGEAVDRLTSDLEPADGQP